MVVASDLLALTMIKPPGEWGADIVCGNWQRFGRFQALLVVGRLADHAQACPPDAVARRRLLRLHHENESARCPAVSSVSARALEENPRTVSPCRVSNNHLVLPRTLLTERAAREQHIRREKATSNVCTA